jgi:hypothetical protein
LNLPDRLIALIQETIQTERGMPSFSIFYRILPKVQEKLDGYPWFANR